MDAVELSDGVISMEAIASKELVTEYTLDAERKTQYLTGISINTEITEKELELSAGMAEKGGSRLIRQVSEMNRNAVELLKRAAAFTRKIADNILKCRAFSYTYLSMLEHIIGETLFHVKLFEKLERRDAADSIEEIVEQELVWNRIMGDHSRFMRGYLDPSENVLIGTADSFAKAFDDLHERIMAIKVNPGLLPEVTRDSMDKTMRLRSFKEQGTAGILECRIKSVIPPLLGDHVLREANRYLRLLRTYASIK